jgi:hypothetical protein
MARGQRDPEREAFWRDVLRRHQGSGLTARAFCRREHLAETAFHAWRRILKDRDAERRVVPPAPAVPAVPAVPPVPAVPAFVPVAVLEEGRPVAADILIELRGGRVMRLSASMAADRLAAIVHAVEGAA